jgi:hypothetical protein
MRFVEANKDPLPQTEGDTKSKEKPKVPGLCKNKGIGKLII